MTVFNARFAPSNTGSPHIGNFRTAFFNYLAAKASGGMFLLRIDDTDVDRSDDKHINSIHDAMNWLGLNPDVTFRQSDRLDKYNIAIERLLIKGKAFTDAGCVRLKTPINMQDHWIDSLAGDLKINDTDRKLIDGLVIRKSDGMPTYNFASVFDDMDRNINFIIRGTDHIANTPKQIAVWLALNEEFFNHIPLPKFAHVGLLHLNGKKISKRDGAASLLSYKDDGTSPEAMCNFMLRLGWSPSDANFDKTTPLIDRQLAIKMFLSSGKMRSSSSSLDLNKLNWYNKKYQGQSK